MCVRVCACVLCVCVVCVCVCVSCNSLSTRDWGDEAGARKRQFEVQFLTRCAALFLYTHKERQTVRAREGTLQRPERPEGEASYSTATGGLRATGYALQYTGAPMQSMQMICVHMYIQPYNLNVFVCTWKVNLRTCGDIHT